MNILSIINELTNIMASIATTAGIIGLRIAYKNFKHTIQEDNYQNRLKKVETSINVINTFNDNIEPEIKKYNKQYRNVIKSKINSAQLLNPNFSINDIRAYVRLVVNTNTKFRLNIDNIINQVEIICIKIDYDLCNNDLIDNHIKHDILEFYLNNQDAIKVANYNSNKYTGLINVCENWRNNNEN